jgi:hypothetical protein
VLLFEDQDTIRQLQAKFPAIVDNFPAFSEHSSGMVQLKKIASASCATLVLLTGCTTSQQRRAQENDAVRTKAAQEIRRICSLPDSEREAEIKRVEDESGMVITCGLQ